MARTLDAKAAAEEIRGRIFSRQGVTAEARHALAFAKQVCDELGLDPDAPNVQAVAAALQEAGIKEHNVQEYPKMLLVDGKPVYPFPDAPAVVFNSAEDERRYHAQEEINPRPNDPNKTYRDPASKVHDPSNLAVHDSIYPRNPQNPQGPTTFPEAPFDPREMPGRTDPNDPRDLRNVKKEEDHKKAEADKKAEEDRKKEDKDGGPHKATKK